MRRYLLAIVIVLTPLTSAGADLADGLQAFDAGDYATAYAEWRPLAEAGDPLAQVALANLYAQGTGVPLDPAEAARWYARAADQGNATGQLNLGDYYARGHGVPRDLVQAYMWLELAARQDHAWAVGRRDEIAGNMTPAEIIAARLKADRFIPRGN